MNKLVFESKLLSDGHLYCPVELSHKKNARFKVIVTYENKDIELSSAHDVEDFLSKEEVNYYLNLEDK